MVFQTQPERHNGAMHRSSYIAVVLILLAGCSERPAPVAVEPAAAEESGERTPEKRQSSIEALRRRLDQQRADLDGIVDGYGPTVVGNITDLDVSAEEVLKSLPGVESVERTTSGENPTKRIIHIRDWHFVSKDDYAKDLQDMADNTLSEAEIDARHEELLLDVELVQIEQMALLRLLRRHYGLDHVCIEGVAERDVPIYEAKVRILAKSGEDMAELRDARNELDPVENRELIEQIDVALEQYRQDSLHVGATGQLVLSGEITEIRPSESLEAYLAANPVNDDGTVTLDENAIEQRQDAIVKMLAANNASLIILGGGHDLANNLPPGTEYLRVTTKFYRELRGE